MPQDTIDTIHHDVLLWKLNNFIGIRGLPLKLLVSYLQGRQQYTVIDGCTSATLNITQRVPRGSSLGPLLFALYVNDLPSTTKLTPTLLRMTLNYPSLEAIAQNCRGSLIQS